MKMVGKGVAPKQTIPHDADNHHVDDSLPSNISSNEGKHIIDKSTGPSPSKCSQDGDGSKCFTSGEFHKSMMGSCVPLKQKDREVVNFTQQTHRPLIIYGIVGHGLYSATNYKKWKQQ